MYAKMRMRNIPMKSPSLTQVPVPGWMGWDICEILQPGRGSWLLQLACVVSDDGRTRKTNIQDQRWRGGDQGKVTFKWHPAHICTFVMKSTVNKLGTNETHDPSPGDTVHCCTVFTPWLHHSSLCNRRLHLPPPPGQLLNTPRHWYPDTSPDTPVITLICRHWLQPGTGFLWTATRKQFPQLHSIKYYDPSWGRRKGSPALPCIHILVAVTRSWRWLLTAAANWQNWNYTWAIKINSSTLEISKKIEPCQWNFTRKTKLYVSCWSQLQRSFQGFSFFLALTLTII